MVSQKELTLLSITPAYDVRTGEYIVQLNFGEVVQNSPEIASRVPPPQPGVSPLSLTQITTYTLVLFVKLEDAARYVVGSKWKLTIGDDGGVSLEVKRDVSG